MLRSKLEQSERDLAASREETTKLKVAFIRLQELASEKEQSIQSERDTIASLQEERNAFQQALEQCATELEACQQSRSDTEELLRIAEEREQETAADCRRLQQHLTELETHQQRVKSTQKPKDQSVEAAKVPEKDFSELEKRYAEAVSTISSLEKRLLLVEREKKEFLGTIQELQRQLDVARAAGVLSGVDVHGIGINQLSPSRRLT
jgi:DNA repair exonuclease SbcCD ATPase subunit